MKIKEHICFMLLFSAVVCLVFWNMLSLKVTFIKADYLQQLYPWSYVYSSAIKAFYLPYWTKYVQCGFPLLAEGQTGCLYPLNLFFFFFLPFKWAYNYSFLFHFILTGIFTYLLARKKGADAWGGALAAVLICFGSGYAGCFVHIAVLRAVTWFPLVLLLYDEYLEKEKRGAVALLIGLIIGMQLLSGSMQMAMYSIFFSFLYFFYRNRQERYSFASFLRDSAVVVAVSSIIAAPQVWETLALSAQSNRESLMTLDFALWNSFSPLALFGTVMPYIGKFFSKGNQIYIGTIGLFFAMISVWRLKEDKDIRVFVLLLGVSLFMALGKYNPLYPALLKMFRFYFFRAPSRFIYFGIFAASLLSGVGFSCLIRQKEKVSAGTYNAFMIILSGAIGIFLAAKAAFAYFGPQILEAAKGYVRKNIYGKPFHRFDLDVYMTKTEDFYNLIGNFLSFENIYVLANIFLVIAAGVFVFFLKRAKRQNRLLKYVCLGFVCVELFVFSFFARGLRSEINSFGSVVPREKTIFQTLKEDGEIYRICPFGDFEDIPLWLRPSMNAVHGIDSIAIYSPLVNRDYFLAMKGLGTVDDSIGIFPPSKEVLYEKVDLLRRLNVKYVIAMMDLKSSALEYITEENGKYLYRLKGYLPRFRFSSDIDSIDILKADIVVKDYGSGSAELEVRNPGEGFLVFAEKSYPGWKVYVDGSEREIVSSSGILQAVKLSPGRHAVVFRYIPQCPRALLIFSSIFFVVLLFVVLFRLFAGGKSKNG